MIPITTVKLFRKMPEETLKIGKARPLLANSSPEVLKPVKGCGGTLQVVWFENIDAHALLYQRDGCDLGAVMLVTHNNGHSCHALLERLVSGNKQRALEQLEYIRRCGGTGMGEEFIAALIDAKS